MMIRMLVLLRLGALVGAFLPFSVAFAEGSASPPTFSVTARDISFTRLKATATSQQCAPALAVDGRGGNYNFWLSEEGSLAKGPQSLTIEMDAVYTVDALRYFYPFPQRGKRILGYQIQVSSDGKVFTTVAEGKWEPTGPSEERVTFAPVAARFVRLVALSSSAYNTASATEIILESPNPPAPKGDVVVPPPANAAARRAAFAARRSPEQLRQLSAQLARFVNRRTPAMQEVVRLQQAGDAEGALRAFNRAFTERLLARYEIRTPATQEFIYRPDPCWPTHAVLAMGNVFLNLDRGDHKTTYLDLGAPGAVDWDNPEIAAKSLLTPDLFQQLLAGYIATGNRAYLDRWAEYVDDMAINYTQRDEMRPFDATNFDGRAERLANMLHRLMLAERERPGTLASLPPDTLPRLLIKRVISDAAITNTFFSSYYGNWYPWNCVPLVATGLVLDDLVAMDVPLLERALAGFSLYTTEVALPDGSEVEPGLGYNTSFVKSILPVLNWIKALCAESEVPAEQRQELLDTAIRSIRFLAQTQTFESQQPLVWRGDGRRTPIKVVAADGSVSLRPFSPLGACADAVLSDRQVKRAIAAHEPGSTEGLTSLFLPWGGYGLIREGWTPESQYGFMMMHPFIFPYSTRGCSDNLNLGIHAFGQDLLVDRCTTYYEVMDSQLRVDGLDQFFSSNCKDPTDSLTRQFLTAALDKPSPARWGHSAAFDFTEGTYGGTYGGGYSGEEVTEKVRDVTHERQVVFVREAGLWVVVDRLTGAQPHNFTWHWLLPCSDQKESLLTYLPTEIAFDANQNRIATAKPGSANLTLQTFTSVPLTFSRKDRFANVKAATGKVCEMDATAQGQRGTLAVTAILPRRTLADDLTQVTRAAGAEVEGFTTTTPNGAVVACQAARQGSAQLKCGNVTATAERLVVVTRNGKSSGLVIGCQELSLSSKPAERDFVFEAEGNRVASAVPILSAIHLVEFSPARNVLSPGEKVTLSCATPGVEIRYTTDGSEPLRTSTLYTKPLDVQGTIRIKARAFRIGLEEPPGTMDFTRDGAENLAVYDVEKPLAPATEAESQPGLNYRYYEGNWQKLYCNPALVDPTGTGVVSKLFDLTPRKNQGPFTFIYEGFLDVPQAGVYSFHMPWEIMSLRHIDAGYDLTLEVGGKRWQPATRRHAFGSWSVALQKGRHAFRLKYVDYRGDLIVGYNLKGERQEVAVDHAKWGEKLSNIGMLRPIDADPRACKFVWVGPPRLEVAGPGLDKQPIPEGWFLCDAQLKKH